MGIQDPLDYHQWPNFGPWIIDEAHNTDLGKDDKLHFERLDTDPAKIKIRAVDCSHNPPHSGESWIGMILEGAGPEANGTMRNTAVPVKITSSYLVPCSNHCHHLDCEGTSDSSDPSVVTSNSGSACWTANAGQ